MRYPCHHPDCDRSFEYEDERSRHERICPERLLSCCQNSPSCRRKVKDWAGAHSYCRHESSGLYGAIREDNSDLVHYFLHKLKGDNLVKIFEHESKFGDTILTLAAALGRVDIVNILVNTAVSLVHGSDSTMAMSDLLDFETSRGTTPLIEAVKNNNAKAVSLLLSYDADAKRKTKTHMKSACDWAVRSDANIETMIRDHTQLRETACSLLRAISNFDTSTIKSLTEGGVPYSHPSQAVSFRRELESKRRKVDDAKQRICEASVSLERAEASKDSTLASVQDREERIARLSEERDEVVSNRRGEVMSAIANIRLSMTPTNIANLCSVEISPREYELLSKSLCILLQIKANGGRPNNDEETSSHYWKGMRDMLQTSSSRFYHRIRHYHFDAVSVELAADAKVEGLPGTCEDHLPNLNDLGSALMTSIAQWLRIIFRLAPSHGLERDLLMEESAERDRLEREKVDREVLVSRVAILRGELDDLNQSVQNNKQHILSLERKIEVTKTMQFVSGGHSILSWAAGVGNVDIVKLLLKRGAHTGVGEECLAWCATIVQVTYRHHLRRREGLYCIEEESAQRRNERRKHDLAVSMRIKSLGNLVRDRLRSLRLPIAEALFNGHPEVALLLDTSDMSANQAMNLFPMFHQPNGMTSKSKSSAPTCGADILSTIVTAGHRYNHEDDPDKCVYAKSLQCALELHSTHLTRRRAALESKISRRRATLRRRRRDLKVAEMTSAMYRGDFPSVVRASDEGDIPLDYEDESTGFTPLIRASLLPVANPPPRYEDCANSIGEPVSAASYLLDRISPLRPDVNYENRLGHTALSMACSHGRLDVVRDLVVRGADAERRSAVSNRTAYDVAVREGRDDVVEFLDGLRNSKADGDCS